MCVCVCVSVCAVAMDCEREGKAAAAFKNFETKGFQKENVDLDPIRKKSGQLVVEISCQQSALSLCHALDRSDQSVRSIPSTRSLPINRMNLTLFCLDHRAQVHQHPHGK